MRETVICGQSRRIGASAFTEIVYERAFGGAHELHEDANALLSAPTGGLNVLPMGAVLRLEYAFERSVAPALFPDYDAWLRALPPGAMDQRAAQEPGGWAVTLLDEVVACFFPSFSQKPDVDAAGQGAGQGAAAGAEG